MTLAPQLQSATADALVILCHGGSTPLKDVCSILTSNWENVPVTKRKPVVESLFFLLMKSNDFDTEDISKLNACADKYRDEFINVMETADIGVVKKLADLCRFSWQQNPDSPLGILLPHILRNRKYLDQELPKQEFPYIELDGNIHFIHYEREPIIKKAPFLFVDQCKEFKHLDVQWSEKDYAKIRRRFEMNHAWIKEKCSAPYIQIIVPDKQTIYDDICPTPIPNYCQNIETIIKAIEDAGVPVVHPVAELKSGRRTYDTYLKMDSHWNDYGAYIGYLAACDRIKSKVNIHIVAPEEFEYIQKSSVGDLSAYMDPPYWETHTAIRFFKDAIKDTRNSTEVPFWAPGGWTIFENYDTDLPVAVVFRDSFFNWMTPFFARSFSKLICMGTRLGSISTELIEAYKPDIIIGENVERLCSPHVLTESRYQDLPFSDESVLREYINHSIKPLDDHWDYDPDIFNVIASTIQTHFKSSVTVSKETTAFDIDGWDSLAHFTLMALLETRLHLNFSDDITYNSRTVGELATNISRLRRENQTQKKHV